MGGVHDIDGAGPSPEFEQRSLLHLVGRWRLGEHFTWYCLSLTDPRGSFTMPRLVRSVNLRGRSWPKKSTQIKKFIKQKNKSQLKWWRNRLRARARLGSKSRYSLYPTMIKYSFRRTSAIYQYDGSVKFSAENALETIDVALDWELGKELCGKGKRWRRTGYIASGFSKEGIYVSHEIFRTFTD